MLFTYEEIIKDDPVIQNLLAQSERAGEARGKLEGKLEGIREGKVEGIREGRLEGKLEGMREGEARGKLEGMREGMHEGKLEGEARGKLEGEVEATRDAVLSILSIRFSPVLAAQARPTVKSIQTTEALKMLLRQIIKAPDEQAVSLLLDLSDEQSQDVSANLPTE